MIKQKRILFSGALAAALVSALTTNAQAKTHIRTCTVQVPKTLAISVFESPRNVTIPSQVITCPSGTFKASDGMFSFNRSFTSDSGLSSANLYVGTMQTITPAGVPSTRNLIEFTAYGPGTFRDKIDANDYADGKTAVPENNLLMLDPSPGGTEYFQIKMSNAVVVKYRTDVTAKVIRRGHSIRIKISASRNQYFGRGVNILFGEYGQTLKTPTVLPKTKADHAVVRRDGKIIARVKLTKYGKGSITLFDPTGKNHYSVTMVATQVNWQGQAKFTK